MKWFRPFPCSPDQARQCEGTMTVCRKRAPPPLKERARCLTLCFFVGEFILWRFLWKFAPTATAARRGIGATFLF